MQQHTLQQAAQLLRYYSLVSTHKAGSGHPTSSMSAADLMAAVMFGGYFSYDLDNPHHPLNDRIIFSKGHASPLFYSLWTVADALPEEKLMTLREFDSPIEGHPTMEFPYTEAATGSLGQGLSIGFGMALKAQMDGQDFRTFVLLGDSEMAEGSVWEAINLAAHYQTENLIGIIDVNRLGQTGETMYGHEVEEYERRVSAFGWETHVIDGHSLDEIQKALDAATQSHTGKPKMIIAKTLKGKGVSFLENAEGWHGKAVEGEEFDKAVNELGEVDTSLRLSPETPPNPAQELGGPAADDPASKRAPLPAKGDTMATRKIYGHTLAHLHAQDSTVVALDAEVSNSTHAKEFTKEYPDAFKEMFIAEQNMVGTAIGMSRLGKIPFVSTFAAFFTRAFDQIRMSQYAESNIKFVGSHAGVSIGQDGSSQMGLEDIAMFRTLRDSVVLYPSDAVSAHALFHAAKERQGNVYVRTTRMDTEVIYDTDDSFEIGGSKILAESAKDAVTVIGAGITLHEARQAYDQLQEMSIPIRVIDLYSVKPLDGETLRKAAEETQALIVVEDHYMQGGMGEAVRSELPDVKTPIYSLAVHKMPHSGKPEELLAYEHIDAQAIVDYTREILRG